MNKRNKGITLISLIVTIIILSILSTIAIYSGNEIIRQAKLNKFTAELKIMQTEINSLYDRYSSGETEVLNYGEDLDSQANYVFSNLDSEIENRDEYRYYNQYTIENQLGLEQIEGEFYVNVKKRSVISREGLEYEGKVYYTLNQLPNGMYNVEYEKIRLDQDGYFLKTTTINKEGPSANNPTIPAGFKPVDTDKAKWDTESSEPTQIDVNEGLVIEDKEGNQFVWIPVETVVATNITEANSNKAMAIKSGNNYTGLLYDFDNNTINTYYEPEVVSYYNR